MHRVRVVVQHGRSLHRVHADDGLVVGTTESCRSWSSMAAGRQQHSTYQYDNAASEPVCAQPGGLRAAPPGGVLVRLVAEDRNPGQMLTGMLDIGNFVKAR